MKFCPNCGIGIEKIDSIHGYRILGHHLPPDYDIYGCPMEGVFFIRESTDLKGKDV